MTLEDMKDYMNMSKSNMSYAIRSLLDSRMVAKLEEKKDRKEQYVAETNFFSDVSQLFHNQITEGNRCHAQYGQWSDSRAIGNRACRGH